MVMLLNQVQVLFPKFFSQFYYTTCMYAHQQRPTVPSYSEQGMVSWNALEMVPDDFISLL